MFATNSLKELNDTFGTTFTSVDELDPETVKLWNQGTPLKKAFAANNWELIRDNAVKKASSTQDNGKSMKKQRYTKAGAPVCAPANIYMKN